MTNPKKGAASQATPTSKYRISADTLEAIRKVEDLLTKRQTIDAKIDAGQVDAKTAEAPHAQALEAQAQADASLALAVEEVDYLACEQAATLAAEAVDVAHRTMVRLGRTVEALCGMAEATDREIADARVAVDLEVRILADEFVESFSAELEKAIEPLLSLLAQAQALNGIVRNPGMGQFLSDVVIPDPLDPSGQYHLIDGTMAKVNGVRVGIADAMRDDPMTKAIADSLMPLLSIRSKLASHRPFVHPSKRPAPYSIRGRQDGPRAPTGEVAVR